MNALAVQVSNDAAINRIRELEADNAALREALSKHVARIVKLQDRCDALQKDINSMAFECYELDGAPVSQDFIIKGVERLVIDQAEKLEVIVRGILDAYNEQERAHADALTADDRTFQWRDEL